MKRLKYNDADDYQVELKYKDDVIGERNRRNDRYRSGRKKIVSKRRGVRYAKNFMRNNEV